jgi:hypothetical protein
MTRVPIPFPVQSAPGETGRTSGGRVVNALGEPLTGERVLLKRAPGLRRLTTSAEGRVHVRGMIAANDSELLVVYDTGVEKVSYFGGAISTIMDAGFLPGTDLVTLARNNAATPQIVCVCALGAFVLTTAAPPANYPDATVGSPNSVCFLDGYFFFTYGDGSCLASKLNSTDIDVLDSVKAESHADGLLRGVTYRGLLFLFGGASIEVYQNTANPTGFPFDRVAVIERGLISPFAVAGNEDGFTQNLIWVAPDRIVYMLNGYKPTRVSSFEVEQAIADLPDTSVLRAFVFVAAGHPLWCLKSDRWTWVYDLLTSTWHERASIGSSTWRAEGGTFMSGGWVLGDETTGALFHPEDGYFYDDDREIEFRVESQDPQTFPDRVSIPRADFDFVVGQGKADGADATTTNPRAMISWSDDSGGRWTIPVHRELGPQGRTEVGVTVFRTGRTGRYGRRWRVVVTDPVYVGLIGGTMELKLGHV